MPQIKEKPFREFEDGGNLNNMTGRIQQYLQTHVYKERINITKNMVFYVVMVEY